MKTPRTVIIVTTVFFFTLCAYLVYAVNCFADSGTTGSWGDSRNSGGGTGSYSNNGHGGYSGPGGSSGGGGGGGGGSPSGQKTCYWTVRDGSLTVVGGDPSVLSNPKSIFSGGSFSGGGGTFKLGPRTSNALKVGQTYTMIAAPSIDSNVVDQHREGDYSIDIKTDLGSKTIEVYGKLDDGQSTKIYDGTIDENGGYTITDKKGNVISSGDQWDSYVAQNVKNSLTVIGRSVTVYKTPSGKEAKMVTYADGTFAYFVNNEQRASGSKGSMASNNIYSTYKALYDAGQTIPADFAAAIVIAPSRTLDRTGSKGTTQLFIDPTTGINWSLTYDVDTSGKIQGFTWSDANGVKYSQVQNGANGLVVSPNSAGNGSSKYQTHSSPFDKYGLGELASTEFDNLDIATKENYIKAMESNPDFRVTYNLSSSGKIYTLWAVKPTKSGVVDIVGKIDYKFQYNSENKPTSVDVVRYTLDAHGNWVKA